MNIRYPLYEGVYRILTFEIRMAGKPPRVIPPAVVSGGFHR